VSLPSWTLPEMLTPQEIWADDLLDRRSEAEKLIAYLESVARRRSILSNGHAHVLAVDAPYGIGKSFFLRRFARHMAVAGHPVAFVDAWVDDLADEPLVALASTLQSALAPYARDNPDLRERVEDLTRRAGRVAGIAAAGLAKRAASFVFTQGSMELMGEALTSPQTASGEVTRDAVSSASEQLVTDAAKIFEVAELDFQRRIDRFREGQRAIARMKEGLTSLLEKLHELGVTVPITIVIDELDRCRPLYAIKLLEEVKHLFDVPGVAFVLGMNATQLTHSVRSAYGQSFDAPSYLRRFINRRYSLALPPPIRLVRAALQTFEIPESRLAIPKLAAGLGGRSGPAEVDRFFADALIAYDLSARDIFAFFEHLQVALALTSPHPVSAPYLTALLVGWMTGESGEAMRPVKEPPWVLSDHLGWPQQTRVEATFSQFVKDADLATRMTKDTLYRALDTDEPRVLGYVAVASLALADDVTGRLADPRNYRELLNVIGRFDSIEENG
jgi:hypothetical protein